MEQKETEFFSVISRVAFTQVLEFWILRNSDTRNCKSFPQKTVFRYFQVSLKGRFAVQGIMAKSMRIVFFDDEIIWSNIKIIWSNIKIIWRNIKITWSNIKIILSNIKIIWRNIKITWSNIKIIWSNIKIIWFFSNLKLFLPSH